MAPKSARDSGAGFVRGRSVLVTVPVAQMQLFSGAGSLQPGIGTAFAVARDEPGLRPTEPDNMLKNCPLPGPPTHHRNPRAGQIRPA